MNNQNPPLLKRDDYKTIKHMNREDLTKYLYRGTNLEGGCAK